MKQINILILVFFSFLDLIAQPFYGIIDSTLLPKISPAHFQPEYLIDVSTAPEKWKNVAGGLNAGFGSANELYFRNEVPLAITNSWRESGWKGERLNSQILIWSPDTLQQVRVAVSDLIGPQNLRISKSNIDLKLVRYVIANFPYGSPLPDCSPTPYKEGFLMPDRFEDFDRFDLPGNTVRPVWISVNIPQSAAPAQYKGSVEVTSFDGKKIELKIVIDVQKQLLPKPSDWTYRLDLWQNPWAVANIYNIKPWGDEHMMLLKTHTKLYADAGGKFITTYGVHSPWGDNEYHIEGGMISWTKTTTGGWKFDYTIFDKYVETMMGIGVDEAITLYTPIPWGERFFYTDERSGNIIMEKWLPTMDIYKKTWNSFLDDFRKHLTKKNWLNKTYIGINENAMEQTLAAISVVKTNWKGWKITYAGNYHKELDDLLDDYSFLYGKEAGVEAVKSRSAKGFTTTYYVCCNPAKPNNFLFSAPVEGRWQGWYAAAHGYDGFLRWAYDAWPEDPNRDSRFGSWAGGDSYLVYPGGKSCIRFEKLREGIVDFEKISILRKLSKKKGDKASGELVNTLNQLLLSISNKPDLSEGKLKEDIRKGYQLIDKLSEIL